MKMIGATIINTPSTKGEEEINNDVFQNSKIFNIVLKLIVKYYFCYVALDRSNILL